MEKYCLTYYSRVLVLKQFPGFQVFKGKKKASPAIFFNFDQHCQ